MGAIDISWQFRPSIEKTLMESAKLWAARSTCSRSQVGVILTSAHHRILATGYNGAPSGMPHCDHTCDCHLMGDVDESHTSACQIWQPCETAVHGEANAIAFSARMGIMLQNAKLFTTLSPCYKCSQLIINSGIEEVVYLEEYRKTDGLELLAAAGVGVVRYTHGS